MAINHEGSPYAYIRIEDTPILVEFPADIHNVGFRDLWFSTSPSVTSSTGTLFGDGAQMGILVPTYFVSAPGVPSTILVQALMPGEQGLPGAPGAPGPPGIDGDDGEPGPEGPTGPTGPTGATGATGATGPPGADGAMGPPGMDGLDGLDGLDGVQAHYQLSGLSADDHHQYLLLAGRSGGQTAIGGSTSGNRITLKPGNTAGYIGFDFTEHAANQFRVDLASVWDGTITTLEDMSHLNLTFQNTGAATPGFRRLAVNPNVLYKTGIAGTVWLVFNFAPVITLDADAAVNLGNWTGFQVGPKVNLASGIAYGNVSTTNVRGYFDNTEFVAGPGGATASLTGGTYRSFQAATTIGAGWTVPTVVGFDMAAPGGTGTITSLIGFRVGDFGSRATTGVSFQSDGALTQLRHAGPVIIGTASAAPNTTKGLDLAGDFATRKTDLALSNGTNNNIAIGNASFIKITGPTADYTITGIATGYDGKRIIIYNSVAFRMTIANENASSTAANRISTLVGGDFVTDSVFPQGAVELVYDATASRWIMVGSVL